MSLSNREIKFRAWDKNQKVMQHFFVGYGNLVNNKLFIGNLWKSINSLEVMQYTGLKDKNGVEIYECDLLKSFYDDGEIHEVIWHEESASFRVATYLDNLHGGTFAELFFMDDINEECNEIIGNIYENPELLKG